MDELIKSLSRYPNGTMIIVEWKNGRTIFGEIDTIYETDNELEPDDKDYQEFYACLLHVTDIFTDSTQISGFSVGGLIEISMNDVPSKILLKDGTVVWDERSSK